MICCYIRKKEKYYKMLCHILFGADFISVIVWAAFAFRRLVFVSVQWRHFRFFLRRKIVAFRHRLLAVQQRAFTVGTFIVFFDVFRRFIRGKGALRRLGFCLLVDLEQTHGLLLLLTLVPVHPVSEVLKVDPRVVWAFSFPVLVYYKLK